MTDDEKDRRAGRIDPELAQSIQAVRDYINASYRTALQDNTLSQEIDWQVDRVLRTGIPPASEEASA